MMTRKGDIRNNGFWCTEPDWPRVQEVAEGTVFDAGAQVGTLDVGGVQPSEFGVVDSLNIASSGFARTPMGGAAHDVTVDLDSGVSGDIG